MHCTLHIGLWANAVGFSKDNFANMLAQAVNDAATHCLRDMGFSSSSSASVSAEPAGAKRDLAFDLLCTHHACIQSWFQ